MHQPTEYILTLARTFPCLKDKLESYHPPVFDPDVFVKQARGWSDGEFLCAMFIVNVWNPEAAKRKRWKFDFIRFSYIADSANRRALQDWLRNPQFP